MPSFTVETRPFRNGDELVLLAGIERAARSAGTHCTRDAAELRWRYGAAPHGAVLALALDERGEPAAGLAATRHRARLEESECHWLEVGDLFNDFARGQGLCRARALLAAGAAFAQAFGGPAPDAHPVMYGVPDRRAHRIGLRHLEWEVLRSENELAMDLACGLPGATGAITQVEEVAHFPEAVAAAFALHSAGRKAILVRDARSLDWRYVLRPGPRFARAVARRGPDVIGWVVLRDGCLHDWGAPPEDEACTLALLAWARELARAGGRERLTAVVPDSAPEWIRFQRLGFRVRGTREFLCFRSFQRPAIMSWLFRHWSYSRGDTLR